MSGNVSADTNRQRVLTLGIPSAKIEEIIGQKKKKCTTAKIIDEAVVETFCLCMIYHGKAVKTIAWRFALGD